MFAVLYIPWVILIEYSLSVCTHCVVCIASRPIYDEKLNFDLYLKQVFIYIDLVDEKDLIHAKKNTN